MSNIVIKVENISKQYRLGQVGTKSLGDDLKRFGAKLMGKEDPFLKIGEENDRTQTASSDYVWALRDINFEVAQGDVLGIIGRNGAGKSTLLKILSQVTRPTTGLYKIKGRIASLLEVGTGFHPDLTGRENVFLNGAILGMSKREVQSKFDEIIDFSGVERYIDTPVKRYSSGMYVRLAFAVAAHLEPEILIVDEVLAVGDADFQKKCIGKMKDVSGQGRTVLFVSHNMNAVKKLCTRGLLIEKGRITIDSDINNVIDRYLNVNRDLSCISEVKYEASNKHLQIMEAKLIDSTKNLITKDLQTNDTLTVHIKYRFTRVIARVHLTIIIVNESGEHVYFIDRRDVAFNFAKVSEGIYESMVNIPNPLLKPGKYYVTLGCGDEDAGVDDHKFQVLSFVVGNISLAQQDRSGYLFLPVPWELNKIQ